MSVCLSSFKPKSTTERSCLKTRHCARDMWMTGDCRVSPFCSNVSNILSTLHAMACIKTARDKENVLFGPCLGKILGSDMFQNIEAKNACLETFLPLCAQISHLYVSWLVSKTEIFTAHVLFRLRLLGIHSAQACVKIRTTPIDVPRLLSVCSKSSNTLDASGISTLFKRANGFLMFLSFSAFWQKFSV